MHDIALFVEDYAHQQVIGSLVARLALERDIDTRLNWRNARHGYPKVVEELEIYLRDLERQGEPNPDLIIVATDANCKGLNERTKEFARHAASAPMILAIPDPHIERWLLLDGAAFKLVFGKGCSAPDRKCDRNRYKDKLIEEIYAAGVTPNIGGVEFAEDIIQKMDLKRACQADASFRRFVESLESKLQSWQRQSE